MGSVATLQKHTEVKGRESGSNRSQGRLTLCQVTMACEDMESPFPGEMPPLEDIEDDGMFAISYVEIEENWKYTPPVGTIKVKGTLTHATSALSHPLSHTPLSEG